MAAARRSLGAVFRQALLPLRSTPLASAAFSTVSEASSSSASTAPSEAEAGETLQLYIFEAPPRLRPALADLDPEELRAQPLAVVVRGLRRAAGQPWRDARFWRRAAGRIGAEAPAALPGRDLAQVCLAFRRIEFGSPDLLAYCGRYAEERRHALNIFELSAVASYVADAPGDAREERTALLQSLLDEACSEWRRKETVPWSAWRALVSAAAQAGLAHQALFTLAAPQLAQNARHMSGRDAADVCSAFASAGFHHQGLLAEVARLLPSMGLRDGEVEELRAAFETLGHEAPLLLRISELRGAAASAAVAGSAGGTSSAFRARAPWS